jgi:5-methylcytosine-specific restriction endonuclease McrA
MREKVWEKCKDNKCDICESNVIKFEDFEAGHIVARNMGGETKLNNLLPMCSHCNRTMSTRNACEYKKDVYPDLYDNWIKKLKPARVVRKKTIKITPVKQNTHIFFDY